MDSDSDNDFFTESFRIVRLRHSRSPSSKKPRPDQEGAADAVYYEPTTAMVALSPDPPSSPMSGDAHSQQRPGTDRQGADAVAAAPMAMEWRSPDPPPRSESSARPRSQPTRRPSGLTLRAPYTVESIFDNYIKRRGALIRALTKDKEAFFQKCDPGMQPLHLYAGTDGSWEVKPPEVRLPPPEPEPTPGINILRDAMERHKWLQQVAVHCDAWLMSISGFAASYMTATERGRLFDMIFDLPMVQEEVLLASSNTNRCMYHVAEQRSSGLEANARIEEEQEARHCAQENRSSGPDEANEVVEEHGVYVIEEQRSSGPIEANEVLEETEEDASDDDNSSCASCGSHYKANAFWIRCDSCKKWYHGKCVNITSSEAEHINDYECGDCHLERVGHDCD